MLVTYNVERDTQRQRGTERSDRPGEGGGGGKRDSRYIVHTEPCCSIQKIFILLDH